VTDDPYDIQAKVALEDVAAWQRLGQNRSQKPLLEDMLQDALVERCRLAVHREPSYAPGFALVLDKRGAKFQSTGHGESTPAEAIPLAGGASVVSGQRNGAGQQVVFYNASMASLTAFLMQGGTAIEDRTGLSGNYTFSLYRKTAEPAPPGENGNLPRDPLASVPWDVQTLGLDLKPAKILQDKLVIDHIERRSAN
jgi:uncharacterized protein (TIGR03435 family)